MDIDNLTVGHVKEITSLIGSKPQVKHPLDGKKVVAVLPNGFIHFGVLESNGSNYMLASASNLRYWKQRENGLPEFALSGPIEGDRIDKIGTVYFDSAVFFLPCGGWDE